MPRTYKKRRKLDSPPAADKPVRTDTDIGRMVRVLEVPDCPCQDPATFKNLDDGLALFKPACEHTLDADHSVSLEDWGELLLAFDHEGYRDRPLAKESAVLIERRERIAMYSMRLARGEEIFHPGDVLSTDERCSVRGGKWLREEGSEVEE